MREIKFRAWDKEMGEMLRVDQITFAPNATKFQQAYFMDEHNDVHYLADCEMMQFTGLLDKNGKEIYEGDILRNGEHGGSVEWLQERCSFVVQLPKPHGYCLLGGDVQLISTEVIGNIYENQELLK